MKRIVVTGGPGFIGSAFVRYQLETYDEVHIVTFDKLTYAGNRENLASVDASKLHNLGWKPEMNWDKGIAQTVDWYRYNESWWRPIKNGDLKEYYEKQYGNRNV